MLRYFSPERPLRRLGVVRSQRPAVAALGQGRDPNTPWQQAWRARLAAASKAYDETLTDEQQDACIAAGAKRRTRPRLGQSGQQTGQQYWVGKECKQKPAPAPNARKPIS